MKLIEILKKINNENNVLINEPMSKHCTFKTGGNAEIFVEAHNETALIETIKVVKENNTPFVVIGKGSNLLISDKGIKGVVIHIGKYFENITCEGETLEIAAGAPLSLVANIAMENSLTGFEFGAGIPASFGGAVFMNAGAYGGEIKNVLTEVRVLTTTFETKTINAQDLDLKYRHSNIEENNYIILSGKIQLEKGNKETIKETIANLSEQRRTKQPLNYPSAGSTFKRPEGYFAGKLVEDCGLKGFTVGGAAVSQKHAGFVVNINSATTQDVLAVIEHCKNEVYKKYGVNLECEVKFLGEK